MVTISVSNDRPAYTMVSQWCHGQVFTWDFCFSHWDMRQSLYILRSRISNKLKKKINISIIISRGDL